VWNNRLEESEREILSWAKIGAPNDRAQQLTFTLSSLGPCHDNNVLPKQVVPSECRAIEFLGNMRYLLDCKVVALVGRTRCLMILQH
jgi:hypothetical protein